MTPAGDRSERVAHAELADDELVRRARDGDNTALDALLRRHYDRIYGVCRRLTGSDADALDAAQDTCITIARRLDRFEGRSSFRTWAYRVATNTCLDELRRRRRRPEPTDDDFDGVFDERLASGPGFDDTVADRLAIDEALVALGPDFRAAVVLRDQLGMDYAEIAEVLDVPIGTVRSRIARGRAALAAALRAADQAPDQAGDPGGNRTAIDDVQRGAP